ncbi:hypothetical protein [Eubacterium sp.]
MNKVSKKILSLVLALALVVSTMTVTFAEANDKVTVTVTIERFTIGQGYLLKPTSVEVNKDASVKDVLEKAAQENNIKLNATTSSYGYYLDSISYADTGVVNIPESISSMPGIDADYGGGYTVHYDAPTNTTVNSHFEDEQKLGGGSFTDLAGWMYALNNKESDNGMDAQPVADGDVVRVQFSVYAAGADIGFKSWYAGIESAKLADKDSLIKKVAELSAKENQDKDLTEAISVLEKYDATQQEVDDALAKLQATDKTTEQVTGETTTPAVTTPAVTTQVPTTEAPTVILGNAKISKVTNVKKYKAKIKIKKVAKAKGYQFKYADNKKFKKSIVKNTTKLTLTTKKFKKNSRCYVKVRAYAIVGKVKSYGKWSKVKSVKIKK